MRGARTTLLLIVLVGCNSEALPQGPGPNANGGAGGSAHTPQGGRTSAFGGSAGSVGLGGTTTLSGGVGGSAAGQAGTNAGGSLSGGSANGGSSLTGGTGGATPSAGDALQKLREYLKLERAQRPALAEQPFADAALDKNDAQTARQLLWEDHQALIRETRKAETDAKTVAVSGKTLRYDYKTFGTKPEKGRSLFISLHGGGEAAASVNDEQWENQKGLYQPMEGVYVAPRAPTNTWNLWHEAHIDPLLERLIENLIVFQQVDPNRVYVMGYSAGGDGVYQLGPRMADSWAAASMMAGHPNDAKPDSLRNIGFTIHVGALDTAFDRNKVASEWDGLLDALEAKDPKGYAHDVQVHPNKPHWMDLEDAVAVPWMAKFTRNPTPDRVVWLQDDILHDRFYWLAVSAEQAKKGSRVVATYTAQSVSLDVQGITRLKVRLSDTMLDLDQPVTITAGSTAVFSGRAPRTIATLWRTLAERGDPALTFPSEVEVTLP